ncbi:MAG TPA: thioredoxin domain-containing protein [Acidimicrobiia bacterium]
MSPLLRDTPRDELGPYLRQHADNPVDWYPWGDEAFDAARGRGCPVLLSVGYSSCHWCHVMAHESFEDPEVAAVMNARFVSVKVDREERPDVDAVYMQAVQALTGGGGWPMTVFLDPEGTPFFGGTYFPRQDRHGLIGFPRLLERVDEAWQANRGDLVEQGARLRALIARTAAPELPGGAELSGATLARARAGLAAGFDPRFGGFGRAPKFPPSSTIEVLLRAAVRDGDEDARTMATVTLDAMAAGGMHDQVGGGFHRYSTDPYWLVPHFEKMLYDQALLLGAYTRGWLVTHEARYQRVAEGIVAYVTRDLAHPGGGWYGAEDADSEGVEGLFYLWSEEELRAVCGDDADEVVRYFGVTADGNFEDPHTGVRGNILHVVDRTEDPPAAVGRALPRLLATRATRTRPGLDDQVIVGWNALFVHALADAAGAFDRPDWLDGARHAARFVLDALRRADGRLLHGWQGGAARGLGFAEDYGALLAGLVSLAEADDVAWLEDARVVADDLVARFADPDGGFFTTGSDAEGLIVRPKDLQDGATPAASSLAASGLLRLAALTGEEGYAEPARRWLTTLGPLLDEHASAFPYLLGALERLLAPPLEVALVGDGPDLDALRREVWGRLLPNAVTLSAPAGVGADRSPLLADRPLLHGAATAYVCERFACQAPVTDPEALRRALDAAVAAPR